MNSNQKPGKRFDKNRFFLKDHIRQQVDFSQTDQRRRVPAPPLQKPCPDNLLRFALPDGSAALHRLGGMSVGEAIIQRESVREYNQEPFSFEELSALLWATQGVRAVLNPACALRTVPSAGARHAFETYVAVSRVEGLTAGLYRYLPFDGQLVQLTVDEEIGNKAALACLGQGFVADAAATLFWTAIPARMEWRYAEAAHKVIAIDVGHVCQNLYLVCTSLGAGTCAIAAYDQDACDRLLSVDGEDEFTVYVAPAGKC